MADETPKKSSTASPEAGARGEAPARLTGAPMDHERRAPARHPVLRATLERVREGRMTRRHLLRVGGLLGVTAAGLGALGYRSLIARAQAEPASAATAAGPRPGGALRVGMDIHALGDPALTEWVEPSNVYRHQYEYLTITGSDNVTRPMLAESWTASDDLKTWSFTLREGVLWRSGRPLTSEDVAFNINRWLDPELGSSNASLFAALTGEGAGVEVVDERRFRLHLSTASLAMAENFYNYPAAIIPRSFEGDPVADGDGTGPYRIVELAPGERAVLRRARQTLGGDPWRYWGDTAAHIGPGLLDEIQYLYADAADPGVVDALGRGEFDVVHHLDAEMLGAASATPGAQVLASASAMTGCMRMRVDAAPFDDIRVRRAMQLCCDANSFPDRVFGGYGTEAAHVHVAPVHPEFFEMAAPARDVAAAQALLAEAGYPDGLDVELVVGDTAGRWQTRACETLRDQAAPASLRISITNVTSEQYRGLWRITPFGMTQWAHRPLGTMALSLAYRSHARWNETGFAEAEFDQALTQAEAILDIQERRAAMETVQRRLQSAAVIVQPVWAPVFLFARERVKGLEAQPTQYHQFNKVWLDAA